MKTVLLLLLFILPNLAAAKVNGVTPVKYFVVTVCGYPYDGCQEVARPFYIFTSVDGRRFYIPAF